MAGQANPAAMIDLRPIAYVIGLLLAALGLAMLGPLVADLRAGNGHWPAFLQSAIITLMTGGLMALASSTGVDRRMSVRQTFLLTTGVWIVLPAFGALPFMLGATDLRLVDAYFEAMSGMTTTGSTVLKGLDDLPQGILLWRGVLQWLGGLGIVIVAMLFLPVMRVGGMQFFQSEGFDTLGKIMPRALDIAQGLLNIYLVLTGPFWPPACRLSTRRCMPLPPSRPGAIQPAMRPSRRSAARRNMSVWSS